MLNNSCREIYRFQLVPLPVMEEDDEARSLSFDPSDDPRFRITPTQQMAAACSGGILTSVLRKSSKTQTIVHFHIKFNAANFIRSDSIGCCESATPSSTEEP